MIRLYSQQLVGPLQQYIQVEGDGNIHTSGFEAGKTSRPVNIKGIEISCVYSDEYLKIGHEVPAVHIVKKILTK